MGDIRITKKINLICKKKQNFFPVIYLAISASVEISADTDTNELYSAQRLRQNWEMQVQVGQVPSYGVI